MRMIDTVKNVKQILVMVRIELNDFLPDTPDGHYEYPWDLSDLDYVSKIVSENIDRILDTCLYDHVAYELTQIKREMSLATKDRDIKRGQKVLDAAMNEFAILHHVCVEYQKWLPSAPFATLRKSTFVI